MFTIQATLEGVAPILFNRWTENAEKSIRTGVTGGKVSETARAAEALEKVYRNDAGELIVPGWNVKRCLLDGCKRAGIKEGRSSMVPFLFATVFVQGDPSFGVTEPDYIDEKSGRRPPRTGGAALIQRPALKTGWRLPIVLNVVDDRRNPDAIRRSLEEAGVMVGLCDFRPEYGRFVVREWNVSRE